MVEDDEGEHAIENAVEFTAVDAEVEFIPSSHDVIEYAIEDARLWK